MDQLKDKQIRQAAKLEDKIHELSDDDEFY